MTWQCRVIDNTPPTPQMEEWNNLPYSIVVLGMKNSRIAHYDPHPPVHFITVLQQCRSL
jgi:hypothetical protein